MRLLPQGLRGLIPFAALALLAGCNDSSGPTADDAALAKLDGRDFAQIDRFGLPAIATVFIPTNQKDAYNTAQPVNDRANFGSFVVAKLMAFSNPDPTGLANALLPDIQPFNTSTTSGFLNGRRLQDDVITAELGLIF